MLRSMPPRALALPLALLALAALGGSAPAQTLQAGTRISAFAIPDQHGREHRVDERVAAILFARDMDASRQIDAALRERGATLEDGRVVWISDLSRMPALITRFVAIPSMRGRPYRMLLDRDGAMTRDFPSAKGKITLLRLEGLRVTAIDQVDSAASLAAALAPLLPARAP
jgi:hypothetical protein